MQIGNCMKMLISDNKTMTDTSSEEVRERVFNTLSNFEFAFNVIELFTVKLIETTLRLLRDLSDDFRVK